MTTDDLPAGEGPGTSSDPADCGLRDEAPLHDWSDASLGIASVVHPSASAADVWLMGTARIGTTVVHWRQGPYGPGGGVSEELPIVLPPEILRSPEALAGRVGTVSVRVVSQRGDEAAGGYTSAALPRLTWTLAGSVDGAPVFDRRVDRQDSTLTVAGETLASADL